MLIDVTVVLCVFTPLHLMIDASASTLYTADHFCAHSTFHCVPEHLILLTRAPRSDVLSSNAYEKSHLHGSGVLNRNHTSN